MVGSAGRRDRAGGGGLVRVAGTAPDPWGRGILASGIETDGQGLLAVHGRASRAWTGAEAAALAMGDAGAAEVHETAQAEILSRFPEAALLGIFDPPRHEILPDCDGAMLASVLGRPVVAGFRSAEAQLGGQGAPLTALYHHALLRHLGQTGPAAVLALDRVPRLTWADCACDDPAQPGACLAFDTGPALPPPPAAGEAPPGAIDEATVARALSDRFLARMPPRLLGPGDFAGLAAGLARLSPGDAALTLAAIVAETTAGSLRLCPAPPAVILLTGAGARDARLSAMLGAALGRPLLRIDTIAAIDPEAVTAQAAAFSAVRVLRGLPLSVPGSSGLAAAVGGGTFSRPPAHAR